MTRNLLQEALSCHENGRLEVAAQLCEQLLESEPANLDGLHLLGIVALGLGQNERAEALIAQALTLAPQNADIHYNLGVSRQELGRLSEAVSSFETALQLAPRSVETLHNLGVAYRGLGDLQGSLGALEQCVALNPRFAAGYNSLAVTLQDMGRLPEAEVAYQRAIALRPGYVAAHNNLGGALLWQDRTAEALDSFRKAMFLRYDQGGREPDTYRVPAHRVRHDLEQVRYLQQRGLLPERFAAYARCLENVCAQIDSSAESSGFVEYGGGRNAGLAPSFNRIVHLDEGRSIQGGALEPSLDVDTIERCYLEGQPQLVVVDDFLRPQALQGLRDYCLASTVWKKAYRNGYLSAKLGHGFESELLMQISEELRHRFPGIFASHRLNQAWAFKYDSHLHGVGIHADFAAVNINFWITPSAANLNPQSGGLIIWDQESPSDWPFQDYNNNEARIRAYLRERRARSVTVPHRENRVVIFNSTLFHETDRVEFREGYENRRINVTLLYGKRLHSG